MIFSANLIFIKTKLFKSHLDEGMQRYTIIFLRSKLLNKVFFKDLRTRSSIVRRYTCIRRDRQSKIVSVRCSHL